ncbi:MAG: hypothetical protein GY948_11795 [Alphaproteobacteria bacterium]|nr:hypothetical protein [Alphaproteobacteria bacterium]
MGLNKLQLRVAAGVMAVLILLIAFPPITWERKASVLGDGNRRHTLIMRKFDGWGFIGQGDLVLSEKTPKKYIPKDPNNLLARDRFMMIQSEPTPDDLRIGKRKIDQRILMIEVAVLLVLGAVAVFFTRTRRRGETNRVD